MRCAGFDPVLFMDDDRDKDGKEDEVTKDCERKVVHELL